MKTMKTTIAATVLGVVLLGGCAITPADIMLARIGSVVRTETAPGALSLKPVASEVRVGDAVMLDVLPRRSGYLYVYHLGSSGSGELSLLFPNAADGANFVSGNTRLPRPNWRMTAKGPQGVGYFLAVLTEQPQDLNVQAEALRNGTLAFAGAYAASMAQVRELP
jgi:hypothetical protein